MNAVTKACTLNCILYMIAMSHYIFNELYTAVINYWILFSVTFFKIKNMLFKAISLTVLKQFGNILKSVSKFLSILLPLTVNVCNELVNALIYVWYNDSAQLSFQQYFWTHWKVINTSLYYQKCIATLVYITASVSLLFHKHSCNSSTTPL